MIPYERRQEMLKLLEQKDVAQISDFCDNLPGVSESTVRRDLKQLEADGQIKILRGGGATLLQGSYDTPVNFKSSHNVNQKERIAKYAASLVRDGESIYIDSGSTALRMIPHLRGKQITIITTNALILGAFQEANFNDNDIRCIVVGGDIKFSTASLLGTVTNNQLRSLYFDKAFLGISGISLMAGFNTPDDKEAEKKKIVKENSRVTYVLADSSKFDVMTLCRVFKLGEIPVITDVDRPEYREFGNYIVAP